MVGAFVLLLSLPMAGYLLTSSALMLRNYIDVCENDGRCTDIEETRFLAIPIVGFIAAIFYVSFGSEIYKTCVQMLLAVLLADNRLFQFFENLTKPR